jgi:hypothetical protein
MRILKTVLPVGLIVLTGLFFVAAVKASDSLTTLRTFDDTGDLNTFFNADPTPQFTNVSTGGISNTGAINVPIGSYDIWTTKQGYSVAGAGDIYTFSAYFKIKENNGYGGLGFASQNENTTDPYGSPEEGIGVYFHGGGGAFVNNRAETEVSWFDDIGDLVLGNWYIMIFRVSAQEENTFDLNLQIWNSDSDGNIGTIFTEQSLDGVVNSDLGGASLIYGYFSAAGSRMEKDGEDR